MPASQMVHSHMTALANNHAGIESYSSNFISTGHVKAISPASTRHKVAALSVTTPIKYPLGLFREDMPM